MKNDHRSKFSKNQGFKNQSLDFFQASSFQLLKVEFFFFAMIILYFDLQPQFKYTNYLIYTSHERLQLLQTFKNTKIKRGTGDKIKNNDKIDTTDS